MPPYDWANGGSVDVLGDGEYGFSTAGEQKIHYIRIEKQAHILPSGKQSPTAELRI